MSCKATKQQNNNQKLCTLTPLAMDLTSLLTWVYGAEIGLNMEHSSLIICWGLRRKCLLVGVLQGSAVKLTKQSFTVAEVCMVTSECCLPSV